MKMIYNEKYDIIDEQMSDSNVGARRGKNIINHIFIINGIIMDILNSKSRSIDIQILDYRQCFDAMWLQETLNDMCMRQAYLIKIWQSYLRLTRK